MLTFIHAKLCHSNFRRVESDLTESFGCPRLKFWLNGSLFLPIWEICHLHVIPFHFWIISRVPAEYLDQYSCILTQYQPMCGLIVFTNFGLFHIWSQMWPPAIFLRANTKFTETLVLNTARWLPSLSGCMSKHPSQTQFLTKTSFTQMIMLDWIMTLWPVFKSFATNLFKLCYKFCSFLNED